MSYREASSGRPLEVLSDGEGSAIVGWVGKGVFYARFLGSLSAKIGKAHAARLEGALYAAPSLRYFSDASALQSYDLLARSAFSRVVMANRRQFASLVMLTWSGGITPAARAFVAAIGDRIDVLTDPIEFDTRLVQAAPLAKQMLNPKTWVQSTLVRPQ